MNKENERKDLRSQFRDWLAEICPKGKPEDYCQIMTNTANSEVEVMKVRLFTHDYRYSIIAKETPNGESYFNCAATLRKPLAGSTDYLYVDLVNGDFTRQTWELIKSLILRFELVRIVADAKEK